MKRLRVLLLLSVGAILLSHLPRSADAVPAAVPDFSPSEKATDVRDVAEKLWEKARNVFKSKSTPPPKQCKFVNGIIWDCSDTTSKDDLGNNGTLSSPSSSFSRGMTAFNGFASNFWNKTRETFSSQDKVLEKPKQWWQKVKTFFSSTATAKPPTPFWEAINSTDFYGRRFRRDAEPLASGNPSSDPEE
ncbi:hypothetical protein R5R35_007097 [Gryllus longicercus]|uniref:Accessory gland protein n=1 Tax=Gryllus longicercus TaxID=2509291 RepID=A0AAN9V7R9_9ORTH